MGGRIEDRDVRVAGGDAFAAAARRPSFCSNESSDAACMPQSSYATNRTASQTSGGTIDEALVCQELKCFVSSGKGVSYPCIFFSRI